MIKKFFAYEEIPEVTKEYILMVSYAQKIEDIPLSDINSFFHGMIEHEKQKYDEWQGGWVL